MYASGNPKTKKMLKEWVASGQEVRAYQPGGMFPGTENGEDVIEGPQYPEPHRWYARVRIEKGVVVKVLG
tara:strand:+ start:59 stop:268 length:210 start_codon:yes stop_codon:yes gene_type:complete